MCLDSAMDNYPTYNLLKDRHIHAFIDLNAKCGRRKSIPDNIHIDKDGTPICQQGERMAPNGYERALLFHDHHDWHLHPFGCTL